MPVSEPTPVKKLKLDLTNYRTMKQADEVHAVEAIIAINPDWFWALMESLLDTGYLPTENILVQKNASARPSLIVKEGNRRIAALKIIHGIIPMDGLPVPQNIISLIGELPPSWKKANTSVPCVIYEADEADTVNRIRSLTHGKGEKAGRDGWTAVARARHNRDENGETESALDLLEKYLANGKNLTEQQSQRWAGDFPLSVLEETLKKISPRLGTKNSSDLAQTYPKIKLKTELDNIIHDIGQQLIGFNVLRSGSRDIAAEYGIPALTPKPTAGAPAGKTSPGSSGNTGGASGGGSSGGTTGAGAPGTANAPPTGPTTGSPGANAGTGGRKVAAVAIQDPKQVARALKKFSPKGLNREKVVSLLLEMKNLKLDKNPIAFCFLLRSMFEISAKAYCTDHKADGLSATKDGQDKKLIDMLKEVTRHLTNNNKDQEAQKRLHGALTEISKPTGILSVTSMNQLVHNPKFAHQASDIATLFGNVFPLLEAMNS